MSGSKSAQMRMGPSHSNTTLLREHGVQSRNTQAHGVMTDAATMKCVMGRNFPLGHGHE